MVEERTKSGRLWVRDGMRGMEWRASTEMKMLLGEVEGRRFSAGLDG